MLAPLLLAGCVFVAPAPSIGDTGTDVRIRNQTDLRLTLSEVGQNSGHDLVTHLAAGEERVTAWHFTNNAPVTLKASDDSGRLVFCHRYSYDDLRSIRQRIVIVENMIDCPG